MGNGTNAGYGQGLIKNQLILLCKYYNYSSLEKWVVKKSQCWKSGVTNFIAIACSWNRF